MSTPMGFTDEPRATMDAARRLLIEICSAKNSVSVDTKIAAGRMAVNLLRLLCTAPLDFHQQCRAISNVINASVGETGECGITLDVHASCGVGLLFDRLVTVEDVERCIVANFHGQVCSDGIANFDSATIVPETLPDRALDNGGV